MRTSSRPRHDGPAGPSAQTRRLPRGAAVVCAALATVATGAVVAPVAGASERTSFLLSRSADGGFPNGSSRNPSVSHDQRTAQLMAFESDASNIVLNDPNGTTDVFVTSRAAPIGQHGTPWSLGSTAMASVGLGGAPANGRSSSPALDGDAHHAPHCVAFISSASNLVAGDTNGQPDAFVRALDTGLTTRVSVSTAGEQANGATTEVSIDGACERIAFTSAASNLGGVRDGRGGPRAGTSQVYVHVLSGPGDDAAFEGLTFLASASGAGVPGDGPSDQPAFGRARTSVVFTSLASNLVRGDRNGTTDVYQRTFTRKFSDGRPRLDFATRLVSATPSGRAGNGASSQADASDDGRYIAFATAASNLLPGDTNGVSDIAEADLGGRVVKQTWVSKSNATSIGDGASNNPSISGAGEFVLFDSAATNLRESASIRGDSNGQRDLFLWNRPTGNVSLESRAAPASPGAKGAPLNLASRTPATSSRGNYVGFVTTDTSIDLPLLLTLGSMPQERHDLVYVRYLGEK